MGTVAYVDESYVSTTAHYLLAAVIVDPHEADELRDATRALRRRARTQFHWHSERPEDRSAMVAHIAARTDLQIAIVSQPVSEGRAERARAKCLGTLLALLASLEPAVNRVVLESRTGVLDKRDIARVGGMQTAGHLTPSLRLAFATKAEPLLWLPDAVAGAINAELADDLAHTTVFGRRLIRIHIGAAL